MTSPRETNTRARLHDAWADVAKAFASPARLELLDALAQGERSVDALARAAGLPVANTSAHLKVLRAAGLVAPRREAQFVHYRLTEDGVVRLLRELQGLARRQREDVDRLARDYVDDRDALEPIDAAELKRRMKAGLVTLVDVRPATEYEAGHIPGAISLPFDDLARGRRRLPAGRPIIAYCRGPYCVLSVDAVNVLRRRGRAAFRLRDGFPDWKAAGHPVATGAA